MIELELLFVLGPELLLVSPTLSWRVQNLATYDTFGVFRGRCFRAHRARLGLRMHTLDKIHSTHYDFGRCMRGVSSTTRAAAGGIDPAAGGSLDTFYLLHALLHEPGRSTVYGKF
jgi:hypothetical protein